MTSLFHTVKLFLYYDRSDDDYKVIAVYPTEKDEIIEIKAEDFIKFDNNTISYYYNNREKTQRIAANSYVIYNGLAISTYDKTIFDFAKGDITFIKPKGLNSYNTVIINDYRDWIVVENNTNDKMLIRKGDGKVIENEDNEVIKYDASEGNIVYAKDAEGNYINIENIKSGTVLNVAQNANVIKIICSDKVAIQRRTFLYRIKNTT